MNRFAFAFAAFAIVAAPQAALAETPFTAEFAAVFASKTRVITDGAVWQCAETTCKAALKRTRPSMRACKELAEKAGALKSFGTREAQLSAEEITQCNTAVRG